MTPEILQRCESCGAVIRETAMFCPECGKALAATKADPPESKSATASDGRRILTAASVAPPGEPDPPSLTRTEAVKSAGPEKHGARQRTRDTLHRASNVARGAIEDNVKRVEKIHHVSSVMFEEAHYDPSLRFVLVAVGLFVVFIILLVLSKVMG